MPPKSPLKSKLAAVERQLEALRENHRERVRVAAATIQLVLDTADLTLDQVFAGASSKLRSPPKVPPKYRSPLDPSLTWAGRGTMPEWIHDLLEAGYSLESLLIQRPKRGKAAKTIAKAVPQRTGKASKRAARKAARSVTNAPRDTASKPPAKRAAKTPPKRAAVRKEAARQAAKPLSRASHSRRPKG